MRFRKLRIAWSVFCGVVCLLLIALWVRSYWAGDVMVIDRSGTRVICVVSNASVLQVGDSDKSNVVFPLGWSSYSPPADLSEHTVLGFAYKVFPDLRYVAFPHWLPTLVAIVWATIPWLHWRFSLRTLLIATSLIAALLGIIVTLNR